MSRVIEAYRFGLDATCGRDSALLVAGRGLLLLVREAALWDAVIRRAWALKADRRVRPEENVFGQCRTGMLPAKPEGSFEALKRFAFRVAGFRAPGGRNGAFRMAGQMRTTPDLAFRPGVAQCALEVQIWNP